MIEQNSERILAKAKEIIERSEYQPGYPMWDDRQKLIKAGKDPAKHKFPGVTWCQAAAYMIMTELGYDMLPLLSDRGIGYTTANAMYENAINAIKSGKIQLVTAREAQALANNGTVCLVLAPGPKHGHVAVVIPDDKPYDSQTGCFIAQAGSKNGFFYEKSIFLAPFIYPEKIIYVMLNEKVYTQKSNWTKLP